MGNDFLDILFADLVIFMSIFGRYLFVSTVGLSERMHTLELVLLIQRSDWETRALLGETDFVSHHLAYSKIDF